MKKELANEIHSDLNPNNGMNFYFYENNYFLKKNL